MKPLKSTASEILPTTVYLVKISFKNKNDIKIRTEISEMENRKTTKKSNESEDDYLRILIKLIKPVEQLIRNKTLVTNIRNEGGDVITDLTDIRNKGLL